MTLTFCINNVSEARLGIALLERYIAAKEPAAPPADAVPARSADARQDKD